MERYYLVCLHDGIGLEVGRLLHETAHQQHGLSFCLQAARVRQWWIIRKTLGNALLQDNQGLMYIALMTNTEGFVSIVLYVCYYCKFVEFTGSLYLGPKPFGLLCDQLCQI